MIKDHYPKAYLYLRIVQAKLFIDNHFCHAINLNDITNEAFFSKYHFIRSFKNIYGQTPHQYLQKVRIEKAKKLLEKGHTSKEVCSLVGFESISSFAGLFKKIVGRTPAEFKLSHIQKRREETSNPLKFVPGCFAMHCNNSNFEE